MSPALATPDKTLNRRRRKHRTTELSHDPSNALADEAASRQTKSDLDLPEKATEASSTPPVVNARPIADYSVPGQVSWSTTEAGPPNNTPKKNRNSLPNGSPQPRKSSNTPRSNQRPISLTPGKQNATPSRAYAGPTFHASPAASSLPMPKFYSKSVPDANKSTSMQAAMKEAAELSSDQSEDSPTPSFAQHVGDKQSREESPLDIFFKADREDRERKRLEQHASPRGPQLAKGSPALVRPLHHTRHSTTGSQGGLFPLELENQEPAKFSRDEAFSVPTTGGCGSMIKETEPSQPDDAIETPQQAEQRRAKTIALKKLLMSSVPATTAPASNQGATTKSTNAEGKPANLEVRHRSNPKIQKQFTAQTAHQRSPCLRSSSNLRKEISSSSPLEEGPVPELSATPTPSRFHNTHKSTPPQSQDRSSFIAQKAPAPSSTAPEATSNPFKAMEDDLRRILKMNDLSSTSAAGVPS
ncbi:MAG: hypothetical protein Q9168_001239 [Polycauliona sp. 1 TL-2023]